MTVPDRINPHSNNGYADRRTATRTHIVATDATGRAVIGPGRNRIQVILGMNTTGAAHIWGYSIGTNTGITGVISQQITSGQVVLNRALMGDSIDDEIVMYDVSGATSGQLMVAMETVLLD